MLRLTAEGREFVHPLLRAAAYAQLSASRRRELHRQLADAAGDAEQRAHHLARAADQPDERAATEIEQGAWQAKRRGAPAVAAELLGHASRLTENEERRARRVMRAASWNAEAGELDSARAAVEALLGDLVPGPLRAEALATLADDVGVPIDRAATLGEEGLAQPGLAAATRARLLLALSDTVFLQNDIRGSAEYAREGLAVAASDGDEELLTRATSWNGQLASLTATADPASFFERARRLEERLPALDPWRAAGHWHGVSLMWGDRLNEARPLLEEQYERSLELGNEFARAGLCFHLAQLECRAGKYAEAKRYAREGQELASLSGNRQLEGLVLNASALVAAHEGDALGARSLAGEALAATGDAGDAFFVIHHRVVLGFVEASLPDYAAARRQLDGLPELLEEMGIREPGVFPYQGDTIEALISLGEPDEVEPMLDALEKQGNALDRPRLLALAWRGRGMLYAADGDAAKAQDAFTRGLAEHERLELPLESARTLLAQGVALRRARQKRSAREALEAAAAIFNNVGAGLWSERARIEISRVGGRAPSGGSLTATELQVAKLAAAGRANKEIAAELHVAVRTVETHLTKVYEKLGIRRRGELAHRLSA